MNETIKKRLVDEWLEPEDVKYLDKAVENLNEAACMYAGYDITNPGKKIHWEYVLDVTNCDPVDIDHVILQLQMFKKKGYTHVDYDPDTGEELIALCHEIETDSECAHRIYPMVKREINNIRRNEMTNEKRQAKIERLQAEIKKLEEEIKNNCE